MIQAILLIVAFLALFYGIVVLVNNPKSPLYRLYLLFSIASSLWILVNAITINSPITVTADVLLRVSQFITPLSLITLLIFNYFLAVFMGRKNLNFENFLGLLTLIVSAFSFSSLNVFLTEDGGLQLGPLYPYYVIVLGLNVLAALIKMYGNSDKSQLTPNQLKYLRYGVVTAFIPGFIFGSIVPVFTDSGISNIAPLFSVMFLIFVGFAVVKHRLFDIRLVVARTLGYLLSVGALAILYGLISFAIINTFLLESTSVRVQQIVYTMLAVVLAFTFQPLKRFFDKWSNKVFYRDAYDSQELLNQLNGVLVSTIELDKLLTNSAQVIGATLKTEYCIFGIKGEENSPQRILGTVSKEFSSTDITEVRSISPRLQVKTIITDELDESQAKLRELLRKNDVAVLVRLTDTPTKREEGIGYMVLGGKKSGSPYSRQDIRVLEIIADELVIAIQNALRFEEIKNFNVTLQEKVDDATKRLRKANQRLIELDQTKDDFISMASHQLRTPLTSVKGYISMVMEGDVGKVSKKQNELLDQAFVSAQRMVYLIADLLNVSRLRTGKFIIEPKETNLADVIEGEISQLKETAKGRNLALTYDKPKDFPVLMLDETKIRQVIMNFADNAIYYTPTGGHIKVGLEDKGDTIEFTVSDDGIGVPKTEQHHLFNKFYRAGNAKKARPDGTGLGLFMAKKVVVAQGGSIVFSSQEGKGSTFGFKFSKKPLLPENFKGIVQNTSDKLHN